ncbi:MAG: DAK2 domain-containing protein [Microthrixaceae bacterium]|nr:DAK2 domain-containing protein [Microthrixaceae bacterium]
MDADRYPLSQLSADGLVDVLRAAHDSMVAHAPGLDRLDRLDMLEGIDGGDTGQHLASTLASVVADLPSGVTLTQLAPALDVGAESGVGRAGRMLAAFLSGVAELCRNADALDASRLAVAFEAGAEAVAAEAGPDARPGAMPAVVAAAAAAALRGADEGLDLPELVLAVAESGLDALEATPDQWAPLAEAGLVDAGGAGFLVLVDAFVSVVHGDDPELPEWEFPEDVDDDGESFADERFRYEITLSLASADHASDQLGKLLQRAWVSLGDEVQLLTAGGTLTASVCADDIGAVIEAAIGLGRPSGIVVRDRRA